MTDFVPTRASLLRKNAENKLFVETFESRKSTKKASLDQNNDKNKNDKLKANKTETKEEQEKEMKKLRFEVMKFGMTGLSKAKARQANLELAIKLGAKPPKNRRQNYKKLKERKKKEEEEKKNEKFMSGFEGSLLNLKKTKKKGKTAQNRDKGLLNNFGKVTKPGQK